MTPSPEGAASSHNQVGSSSEDNGTLSFAHAGYEATSFSSDLWSEESGGFGFFSGGWTVVCDGEDLVMEIEGERGTWGCGERRNENGYMGKRVTKRVTVDLVDEDEEEEEHIRQCARWTRDEEILLTECWIETFENRQIGADRTDDSFWRQIMDDFNSGTTQGYRTKHMLTGKWSRINGDCQKFNAIYKHIERKSEDNEAEHIEAAKITFAA
nr:glutathione S-transferase T3-like [Tanacetum cinerariifolium]